MQYFKMKVVVLDNDLLLETKYKHNAIRFMIKIVAHR